MERVLVIHGPNLNLLGTRDPSVYGSQTLADLDDQIAGWGRDLGVAIDTYQSNHEGAILDRIQATDHDAIIINAGALTHYSYSLHDAIEAIPQPTIEVHISNIRAREPWRRRSVIAAACVASIYGRGARSYRDALRHLVHRAIWPPETVAYASDSEDQVGDLRIPHGDGPFPVAVIVHGGFWADVWQRDLMDAVAIDLSNRGWATWNIEYRRVGSGGGWPGTHDDMAAALDAVPGLSERLDPRRVVIVGHSAGGQVGLWAASRPPGPSTVEPCAVIGLAPVTDLVQAYKLDLDDGGVARFLRRSPDKDPDRYARASPTALLPLGTPQVIVHGDLDDRVPVQMSRTYAGDAADAGDQVRYHEFEGVGHFELIDPGHVVWSRIAGEIDQFG